MVNQTYSRYLIYIIFTFGKFSVFSLTTLMSVKSVALKTQFTSQFTSDWVRCCEREFPNHPSTVCAYNNYNNSPG